MNIISKLDIVSECGILQTYFLQVNKSLTFITNLIRLTMDNINVNK